jgi:hypothetical protein
MLSTPVLEAPSISVTSIDEPSATAIHEGHLPQGPVIGPSTQFKAFANMRAVEVFPTPLGPEKI